MKSSCDVLIQSIVLYLPVQSKMEWKTEDAVTLVKENRIIWFRSNGAENFIKHSKFQDFQLIKIRNPDRLWQTPPCCWRASNDQKCLQKEHRCRFCRLSETLVYFDVLKERSSIFLYLEIFEQLISKSNKDKNRRRSAKLRFRFSQNSSRDRKQCASWWCQSAIYSLRY